MFRSWTSSRLKADLDALEASARRAGAALACVYSCSEEFEAAMIRLRRRRFDGRVSAQMRLVVMATVGVAVVALAVMAL